MLQHIRVQNIALIEDISLDLEDHFNVLTGETGSGKSIILDAVNLALGQRGSRELLRDPDKPAQVDLLFSESNPRVLQKLDMLGAPADSGEILISRRVMGNGRSVCKLNGEVVNTSLVKDVGSLLIDIHGQHEHQSLLDPAKHIDLLDRFSEELLPCRQTLAGLVEEYGQIQRELNRYSYNEQEKERRLSLLQYEAEEIEKANLREGEEDELNARRKKLLNSAKLREGCSFVYGMLKEGSQEALSAVDQMGEAVHRLEALSDYDADFLTPLTESLRDAVAVADDVAAQVREYGEQMEDEEGELDALQRRLDEIYHIKMKYGHTVREIQGYKQGIDEEIRKLANLSETVDGLRRSAESIHQKMEAVASQMSKLRKQAAAEVEKKITQILETLQFQEPIFRIQIQRREQITAKGFDSITFMIRTNVGDEIKPLNKIASGGEMSRVMLAIKTVLAQQDEIGTLIFDEIDAGISGRTAQSVAEKICRIARYHQVICITHLPQIAAMADHHLYIEKRVEAGHTKTYVRSLEPDEMSEELARLIGGAQITETARRSAKEMKKMAQDWKLKIA